MDQVVLDSDNASIATGGINSNNNNNDRSGSAAIAAASSLDMSFLRDASTPGGGNPIQKSGQMFSQLESMMMAVKKEALALEKMKVRLKEIDDLKIKNSELKSKALAADSLNMELERKLIESESVVGQLRNDMQHINDIFNSERQQKEEKFAENANLINELSQCKNELMHFQREVQKMGELKKMNGNLMNQLTQNGVKMEEDRLGYGQIIDDLKKKCRDLEIANNDASKHFWNLSEEMKALKRENLLAKESQDDIETLANKKNMKLKLMADRAQMCNEDYVHLLEARYNSAKQLKSEMQSIRKENESLKGFIATKDEAYSALTSKFKALEDARSIEKGDIKAKIASLNDTILQLKAQNHEFEREVSDARHQLALSSGEIPRYESELESQRLELQRAEQQRLQREADFSRDIKSVVAQRDELLEKLQALGNQLEASKAQARAAQQRFWEVSQGTKDAETELREENNKLSSQLQQKGMQVISLEAEKVKIEEVLRHEVTSASNMVNTLRNELEKRLEELSSIRKERDTLRESKDSFDRQAEEMQETLKRQEQAFKKAMEGDRSKIQVEIKHMMNRIKTLENEKQELLREFDELMNQINETGKELGKVRIECEELKRSNESYVRDIDSLNQRNREIMHELKMDKSKEEDLREKLTKLETQYKDDITRLDTLVKESKKTAAQQVLEISGRAKDLMAEIEDLKSQKLEIQFSEKKAYQEVEKARAEVVMANQQHEQISQQMVSDITMLRRELQDFKMKSKIIQESKTKLEVETMNARMEVTKFENDMARLMDSIQQFELKLKLSEEEKAKLKADSENHAEEVKKLKIKIVEAETVVAKKNQSLEKAEKELHRVERESQGEVRRLRLQCSAAEQELAELKPLMPMLQKEIAESKSNFNKLQHSTNSSVNGLLEELRSTEDVLSTERKRFQTEIENYRGKITELNLQLDKTKENLEESMTKAKSDRSDRDMRILQLEGELERANRSFNNKDSRVEELEKQHQTDRLKLHESKDKIDMLERFNIELKSNLEVEMQQRRRLENRLKEIQEANHLAAQFESNISAVNRGAAGSLKDGSPSGFKYSMDFGDSSPGMPPPPANETPHNHSGNMYTMANAMQQANRSTIGASKQPINIGNVSGTANNQMLFKDDDDILAETPNDPRHWLSLQNLDNKNPNLSQDYNKAISNNTKVTNSIINSIGNNMSPVVNRVSATLAARALADTQQVGSSYGGTDENLSLNNQRRQPLPHQQLFDDVDASAETSSSTALSSATEDMIAKTQKFLNRKLNGGAANPAPSSTSQSQQSASGTTSSKLNGASGVNSGNTRNDRFNQAQQFSNKSNNENNPHVNFGSISNIESVDSSDYKSAAEMALQLANAAFARQNQGNTGVINGMNSNANGRMQQGSAMTGGATYMYNDDQRNSTNGGSTGGLAERDGNYSNTSLNRTSLPTNLSMFTHSNVNGNGGYPSAAQNSGRSSGRSYHDDERDYDDNDQGDDDAGDEDAEDDDRHRGARGDFNDGEYSRSSDPSSFGSQGRESGVVTTKTASSISGLSYRVASNDESGQSGGSGKPTGKKGSQGVLKTNSRPGSGNNSFENVQLPKIGSQGNLLTIGASGASGKSKSNKKA